MRTCWVARRPRTRFAHTPADLLSTCIASVGSGATGGLSSSNHDCDQRGVFRATHSRNLRQLQRSMASSIKTKQHHAEPLHGRPIRPASRTEPADAIQVDSGLQQRGEVLPQLQLLTLLHNHRQRKHPGLQDFSTG